MITLMDAVQALKPGAECNIRGDVYSGIEWLDKTQTIPTEEEVTAKMKELTDAEPMKLLREERNKLIAETDWTQLKDISLDSIREKNWKEYRQALRDLPNSSTPKLDSFGNLDLSSVSWPDKPST
tara:strand:+ start:727 stop:1101 length:375 start_codon:yes stop_codon:yes gene_type:complete